MVKFTIHLLRFTLLCGIFLIVPSNTVQSQEPNEDEKRPTIFQQRQVQQYSTIQVDEVPVLQREVRRLNSVIVDMKVELDNVKLELIQARKKQPEPEFNETDYLLTLLDFVFYFEQFCADQGIEMPAEVVEYQQFLILELQDLGVSFDEGQPNE
jgi:hypothetical protein